MKNVPNLKKENTKLFNENEFFKYFKHFKLTSLRRIKIVIITNLMVIQNLIYYFYLFEQLLS